MKKYLFYVLAILIGVCLLLEAKSKKEVNLDYKDMLKAKEMMLRLSKEIHDEKIKKGIKIDKKLDITESGLIGEEFTGITTTLGDLDSKRLSTNPDFAAYFIKKLKKEKVKKGDIVYINMSSSFPGLNLSIISALDVLEINGVIINSLGSSMYGANNEEFTFLEMVNHLKNKNLIKNTVELYSLGGDSDEGKNFDENTKEELLKRLEKVDIKRLEFKNIDDNIEKRILYYKKYPNPKYFINIGGNLVSTRLEKYYKSLGIPTLTMLNIKQIALANKISNTEKNKKMYETSQSLHYYFIILILFVLYILDKIIYMKKKVAE